MSSMSTAMAATTGARMRRGREAGRGSAEPGAGSGGIGSAQRGAAARALDGPPDTLGMEPAVRTHDLPGDEARLVRSEEDRHRRDLIDRPDAAERRAERRHLAQERR